MFSQRSPPALWDRFNLKPLQDRPIEGEWQYFPAKQGGDVLEITFGYLPNGYLLEVGRKNLEDPERDSRTFSQYSSEHHDTDDSHQPGGRGVSRVSRVATHS